VFANLPDNKSKKGKTLRTRVEIKNKNRIFQRVKILNKKLSHSPGVVVDKSVKRNRVYMD